MKKYTKLIAVMVRSFSAEQDVPIAATDSFFIKGKLSFHEMRAWISGLVTNQAGQLHNESKIFAQKCKAYGVFSLHFDLL